LYQSTEKVVKENKEKKLLSKIVASGLALISGGAFLPKISANPPAVSQDTEKSSKLKWVGGGPQSQLF
jgi:hypothetical protein